MAHTTTSSVIEVASDTFDLLGEIDTLLCTSLSLRIDVRMDSLFADSDDLSGPEADFLCLLTQPVKLFDHDAVAKTQETGSDLYKLLGPERSDRLIRSIPTPIVKDVALHGELASA